jgi:hypothetical protein
MSVDPELRHFEPLVAALVASGNALADGGFVPSQGGPVCHFVGRLNAAVVEDFVTSDPDRLSYDAETDTVHCRHCWGAVIGGRA